MTARSSLAPRGSTITVVQGEFRISDDPHVVLSTVLGSCVAVCLYDPTVHKGGMNHFLLPERAGACKSDIRFGAHAMELLINGLLKIGGRRETLRAKVFGGSSMATNLRDIGQSNAEFAKSFLHNENIPVVSESLGGTLARRVRFWPVTGRAKMLLIPNSPDLQSPASPRPLPMQSPVESVTLF
ncbi:chemotaxis protein CheD [Mesobacterium sp. TK19101]|uniref:Probable chemoreceptor glutamine deamidase CheD n=1 Tax=Mesobacterium hydrothermale TaxID=3111907 RepID=A0ABU6HL03_9RHOB|nr:chemotaxis protein CheD [Mesobacterium sp. TK19101]MEC3862525.1 chemotaxis protein CheD [Mesobacterium sp. TK19101]